MTPTVLAGLLPLAVIAPVTGAVLAPLLARVSRRLTLTVSVLSLAVSTAVLLLASPAVFGGRVLVHHLGGWTPVHGASLGIAFAADPFGLTFALLTAVIGLVLLVHTLSELGGLGERELGGYAVLFQLLLAALIGAALTADLFNLFVWFEVAALASYGLTGFFLERPIALEAGFKILLLTTVAGFSLFVGIGLLYARHGALNLGQLHASLTAHSGVADRVALGLLVCGFATKAGLVPFHAWLADAHTAAPGPVSALFSGLMVNLGIVAIGRLAFQVFTTSTTLLLAVLTVTGVLSALVGAAMALVQDDLKRLLAYDTVSQMGILAVGLGTGRAAGVAGAAYHLVNHALFKSLLFLCAGAVVHATGLTHLSQMGGIARRRPLLAVAFTIGCLSIAGMPPLNGYVSLSLVHRGLHEAGDPVGFALVLVAQVLTLAALGRASWLGFYRRREEDYERFERPRPGMVVAFWGLSAGCVAFGVIPRLVLTHLVVPATSALLRPGPGLAAVVHGGGRLSPLSVPFEYVSAEELLVFVVSVVLAVALVVRHTRRRPGRAFTTLRRLHTGSANDYLAFSVAGTVVVLAALTSIG
ncbi:MAG: complex I subunit 5 family protein [Oryzihumus sp.]